jgi:hypothetical protein
MSKAVTVSGTPTLILNDGGTATYNKSVSTPSAGKLVFNYAIQAAQNASNLQITNVNLARGASVKDSTGHLADFANANGRTFSGLQVDTTAPTVISLSVPQGTGHLAVGDTVAITVTMGKGVLVTGSPTLQLNDSGVETYDLTKSDSSTGKLVFDYAVKAGEHTADFQVSSLTLPSGSSIVDSAGNPATLNGVVNKDLGVQVGLVINPSYGSLPSTAAGVTQFKTAVNTAILYFEQHFTNPITLNLTFDYAPLPQNADKNYPIAQTVWTPFEIGNGDYTSVADDLATLSQPDQQAAYRTLPSSLPSDLTIDNFESTAAGVQVLTGTCPTSGNEATITLDSMVSFFYSQARPVRGEFDAIGALEHEISEAMGRVSGINQGYYTPLDLYRYKPDSNNNLVRDVNPNLQDYFSVDGSQTLLWYNKQSDHGDFGDWRSTIPPISTGKTEIVDAFGGQPVDLSGKALGAVLQISTTDLREMNLLGWNLVSAS